MECPKCHNRGNLLKRPFVKRKGLSDQYCVRCGARVKVKYRWKNIALLSFLVLAGLIILHYILVSAGYPGLTGGMAGGIAGAVMVILMRRPFFVTVELVGTDKNKNSGK